MLNDVHETNKLAYQYHQSVYENFVNICNPIIEIGINDMYYIYCRSDGRYLLLTTSKNLADYHFFNVKNQGDFFTNKVESTGNKGKNFLVCGDVKRFDLYKDPILYNCWEYNFWNFFVHYDLINDHSMHGWGFSLGREFEGWPLTV